MKNVLYLLSKLYLEVEILYQRVLKEIDNKKVRFTIDST